MERVKLSSEKACIYLNVGNTKVMITEDQGEMVVDGKHIEVVSHFIFLGSLITRMDSVRGKYAEASRLG